MSRKAVLVLVVAASMAGVAFVIAQEGPMAPPAARAGRGPLQPRGPMAGPMGEWLDNLSDAHAKKDMVRIGQLIDEMKQRRRQFQERMGPGGPGAGPPPTMRGQSGPPDASQSILDSEPMPRTDAEKKILAVLDDMAANQRRGMMNVARKDGRLLRMLTEAVGARHVVEIGTSNGYSGIWFCLALQKTGGKLTTHEINAERASLARENFKKAGIDKLVTLVEGDAHETVTKIKEPIDVLFLDADKEGYIDYLKKLLPLLRPGGLVLAHNMNRRQADTRYVEAITTNPDLETLLLLENGSGVGVTLKKR